MMEDPKYDGLKLENQICFPLYACSKEIVRKYKPFLDQLDLTFTQYIVMLVLWEQKKLNVKELGERLYLDSGTLTPVLKKLEAKGYVDRNRSLKDERNLIVSITKKGEGLKEKATDIPERLKEIINLSQKEIQELYDLLYKLLDTL